MTLTLFQIIKDLQLLGLVAALVIADVILLLTWVLTDPIQCLQILGVSMTVRGPIPGEFTSWPGGLTSVGTQGSFSHEHSLCGHAPNKKISDTKRRESEELWLLWMPCPLSARCAPTPAAPPAPGVLYLHALRCQHTGICLAVISASTLSIMRARSNRKLLSPNCWEVKVGIWGCLWSQSTLVQILALLLSSQVTLGKSFNLSKSLFSS